MDCPKCYGRYASENMPCRQCEFNASCRYYTDSEKQLRSRSERNRTVNMEKVSHLAARGNSSGSETVKGDPIVYALSRFFRYLLALDSYTLGIISQIITDSANGERPSVSQLSKLRGCSRQAMHRKLLSVIARNPELAGIFAGAMSRIDSGRRLFNAGKRSSRGI